jgi:PAS domain S-box-containing protein
VSVVRNAAGAFRYFLAIISNITEHKRAEDELRLVSAALEVADSAIVITDRAGVIQWANLAFTTLTGYTQAEALGKNSSLLKSGKHEPAFYKSLWDTILSGRVWRGEMANRRKNGSVYSEEMTITPVRDGRGEIGHFIAIKQDITERKKLQAQLLRTQRLESVGRLASGIAHDLNNLLSPMLLAPQLLRESIQDPDLCSLLDLIETNARRGSDIIKQLLTFGRGVESERVPVQLRALVLDMAGIIRETFPKNITTRRETPAEAWLVKGDATQLHQILMNLCVNARDAMPEGGTLTLKLENQDIDESFARMIPGARPGRYVCLSVTDTGQGIAPEHLDKIYDPFFTTKELGQGTGLGLSTVLGIVQSHGGFIQVQSQPGHGTQFKVYLSASETAAASPASQADQPILQGHGELVLMVDDEESVRQVTRQFLECNGYRMIEAENGTTAVVQYAAHQQQVQVVVTDLIMPVMDGPAFIQVLRRMNPQVRVIVMSGQQDKPGLPADLRIPDEARLAKPFSGAMLLQTLHRVLHPEATPKN